MTDRTDKDPRPPGKRRSRRRRRPRGGAAKKAHAEQAKIFGDAQTAAAVRAAARRLGINRLYPEQELAISHVLAGRNVLMVLPTGSGKSACYQIPSMVLPKPVVVISPLLALLRDQHDKLAQRGIPCVRLDGTVRGKARRETLERIAEGGSLLVLTTPETLGSKDGSAALAQPGVSLAAVDEAHCVSEWGHDFRPSYVQIGTRLRELGDPPRLALTATATPHVREAILELLRMEDPELVAASPHRSNLAFEVIPCEGDKRLRALVRLVQRLRRPGIVYCATRREVDAVHALLRRLRVPTYRYHGGMTAGERETEQQGFMRPRQRSVMVATSAFGLGIDKSDIRYILHYQAPSSLEQYVQEAGRGGRDGNKANCILLSDPGDRKIHEALLATSRIRPDHLRRLGVALAAYAAEDRTASNQALALSAELGPRITAALVAKMEEAELVHRDPSGIKLVRPLETIEDDTRRLAGQYETLRVQDSRRLDALRDYAATTECRAAFLCDYFGEQVDAECGLCDSCSQRDTRPATFFAPLVARHKTRTRGKHRSRRRGGRKKPASGPGRKRG